MIAVMAQTRTPQDADKYIVRFPDGMRDRIAEAAKVNGRSMNSELIARLERSFDKPPPEELLRLFNGMLARMLVKVIDELTPTECARFEGLPQARRLADAVLNKDGTEMAEAFADILQAVGDAEAEDVRNLRNDPHIKASRRAT